jgi:DNA-directed RNA polymerase subunit omega
MSAACRPHVPSLEGIPIATIDELLSRVDSKYTLVHLSARRAREINNYYHSLGEGLGHYVPPLVDQVDSNKPLSIALEEIARDKIVAQYPGDARQVAESLFGEGEEDEPAVEEGVEAEIVAFGGEALGAPTPDAAAGGDAPLAEGPAPAEQDEGPADAPPAP